MEYKIGSHVKISDLKLGDKFLSENGSEVKTILPINHGYAEILLLETGVDINKEIGGISNTMYLSNNEIIALYNFINKK